MAKKLKNRLANEPTKVSIREALLLVMGEENVEHLFNVVLPEARAAVKA